MFRSHTKCTVSSGFHSESANIEQTLQSYGNQFRDKTIYCNCDNTLSSEFWKYFHENFAKLGLKRLIATCYEDTGLSGVSIYDGGHDKNITCCSYKLMQGDGDFRSEECVELLKQSDIVVTEPPASLFKEFVAQLFEYEKRFLLIGYSGTVSLTNLA